MTTESDDTKLAIQLSIIIGVALVLLNVVFYFLSGFYYADKQPAPTSFLEVPKADPVSATRLAFGVFSGVVAGGLVGAVFAPRWVGHILAGGFGIASLVAGGYAFDADMPTALSVTLIVLGGMFPTLAVFSMLHKSRAAWSFLVSMCWVLCVTMLFGAPKVRTKMEIGLWWAMIIPGLLAVAGVALSLVRRDYREGR